MKKKAGAARRLEPKAGGARAFLLFGTVVAACSVPLVAFEPIWSVCLLVMAGVGLLYWLAYAYSRRGRARLGLGLWLDSRGFAERNPMRWLRLSWGDVESFFVANDEGRQVVAFRLRDDRRRWYHLLPGSRSGGYDGHLIEIYDLDPEELADLLESWRIGHGKDAAAGTLADDAL